MVERKNETRDIRYWPGTEWYTTTSILAVKY